MSPIFSPLDTNLIGLPVTAFMDKAAPPLLSPSALDRIAPVNPISSSNVLTKFALSWPVIASTTSMASVGSTSSLMFCSSAIMSESIWSLPAVSTITLVCPPSLAYSTPLLTTSTGLSDPSTAKTGTSILAPSFLSCSTAAGLYVSAATRQTDFPSSFNKFASFPQVVVLPTPWSPSMRMTCLSPSSPASFSFSFPIRLTSSSLTTFTSCWSGSKPLKTPAPVAFFSTFLMNDRVTVSETSASSRARRMSFSGSFRFDGVSSSTPFTFLQVSSNLLVSWPKPAQAMWFPLLALSLPGLKE
mmetsp:Transcript_1457/g.4205  ORF Transcript_1457/g.4205 Transcript_1457/m.4205 type:complete len:300 (+) Transcript_1457:2145-3044(+)